MENKKVVVDFDLLSDVIDSLSSMIDYADDGLVSRYDKNFKDFFEDVDFARENLEKLYKVFENEE